MGGKRGKGLVNNFNFTPYLSVRIHTKLRLEPISCIPSLSIWNTAYRLAVSVYATSTRASVVETDNSSVIREVRPFFFLYCWENDQRSCWLNSSRKNGREPSYLDDLLFLYYWCVLCVHVFFFHYTCMALNEGGSVASVGRSPHHHHHPNERRTYWGVLESADVYEKRSALQAFCFLCPLRVPLANPANAALNCRKLVSRYSPGQFISNNFSYTVSRKNWNDE